MDKAVNAFFNTYKYTEISDIFDFSFDYGANRVIFTDQIPGIRVQLFHAQGYTLGLSFYVENHNLNFVSSSNKLGWMSWFFGPGHFRDMDKSFNAFFKLNKNTIVGNADNLADSF